MENEEYNEFKKRYESYSYGLPDFDKLEEDFNLEKAIEKNVKFVLRNVRFVISEKIAAYLHFFEMLINPSSPPIFIYSFLNKLTLEEKETIKEIYSKLSVFQLSSIKLDTIYNEEKEADFVIKSFNEWQELKKDIMKLFEKIEPGFEEEIEKSEGAYFN